jgi:hypothetical protein
VQSKCSAGRHRLRAPWIRFGKVRLAMVAAQDANPIPISAGCSRRTEAVCCWCCHGSCSARAHAHAPAPAHAHVPDGRRAQNGDQSQLAVWCRRRRCSCSFTLRLGGGRSPDGFDLQRAAGDVLQKERGDQAALMSTQLAILTLTLPCLSQSQSQAHPHPNPNAHANARARPIPRPRPPSSFITSSCSSQCSPAQQRVSRCLNSATALQLLQHTRRPHSTQRLAPCRALSAPPATRACS